LDEIARSEVKKYMGLAFSIDGNIVVNVFNTWSGFQRPPADSIEVLPELHVCSKNYKPLKNFKLDIYIQKYTNNGKNIPLNKSYGQKSISSATDMKKNTSI
jgi:hypothetical protein